MQNYFLKTCKIPVLPLRGLVVFPQMVLHFDVTRRKSVTAVNRAMDSDRLIFLCSQTNPEVNDPGPDDLFDVGVVGRIKQTLKQPGNTVRIVVEGVQRARVAAYCQTKPYAVAEVDVFEESAEPPEPSQFALMRVVRKSFENYLSIFRKTPPDILFKIGECKYPGELADFICGNIPFEFRQKQELLEEFDPNERLERLFSVLNTEIFLSRLEHDIYEKAQEQIDQNQREYFLREQVKAIQEELGEEEDPTQEADTYRKQILKLALNKEAEKVLLKECDKLEKAPYGSHEVGIIRTYLDTCLELPWNTYSKIKLDIEKIRKVLDKQHYGLQKVKDLIIEQLAVAKLAPKGKGQILCLVGPPGVGKTSIAQSIAGAVNRKAQRIALGGVRDEAEIRGHRRTYVGAMPGRLISAIKRAGTSNPLLILDEIDKLAADFRGDPTSALLEVLDSEQNHAFYDHYLDIPYDLTQVMFIATANDYSMIPAPLRDRMDIIEIESYTREEKFNIAKKHLVPKQLKNCGLTAKTFKIDDSGIYALIDFYTREAGVRALERKLISVMRKSAVKLVNGEVASVKLKGEDLENLLGPKRYLKDNLSESDQVGVVNGLAWTSVGGELLPIEVAVMLGTGKLELTGSLGDVMKESAKTAVSCIRSYSSVLGIDGDFYKNTDIHIHAPEGAVPKDGPSAGIAMATAIYSALSHNPISKDVAMTGEITLRGRVLPIGGLKEKSIAAYKNGIKTVIIPNENNRDLYYVDKTVKEQLNYIPVKHIFEVLKLAVPNFSEFAPDDETQTAEFEQEAIEKTPLMPGKPSGYHTPAIRV
ncbi:MAG: endopeptidase La [Oscillospiraceae bacterium]|jgi:ATP-dependent Lon protease|nr:endopeptidase La [Oscillospiraceae bacterium]